MSLRLSRLLIYRWIGPIRHHLSRKVKAKLIQKMMRLYFSALAKI